MSKYCITYNASYVLLATNVHNFLLHLIPITWLFLPLFSAKTVTANLLIVDFLQEERTTSRREFLLHLDEHPEEGHQHHPLHPLRLPLPHRYHHLPHHHPPQSLPLWKKPIRKTAPPTRYIFISTNEILMYQAAAAAQSIQVYLLSFSF
jgi:hypothetical protein